MVDEATLRGRLEARTGDAFGATRDELAAALEWCRTSGEDYRRLGVPLVDATRPVHDVVDEVLRLSR